jgi:hypothetical protein
MVTFNVAATNGPGRAGALNIADKIFTVNQGQGCAFALSSSSASEPAAGGNGSFDLRTADGCAWTASSSAPWLTISSGANGTGNGTVRFAAAANTGPQRTATITAGGQTFTVTQGGGCTYSISPGSQNLSSAGGNTSVAVTAPGGCSWTASSHVPWITISSGASGSGNGSVQLAVAATTDAARSGTVTIGGQTFTVNQASGCTLALGPTSQTVAAGGGTGSFTVTTGASCGWTATSTVPWTTLTSGAAGTGNGTVQFTVAANTGSARSGSITVGGQTFSIAQDGGCTFAVAPDTLPVASSGGSPTVGITAGAPDCAWTAVSNVAWVSITVGAGGTGNGTSRLDVQANSGPARSGTATVAGRTVTVNQDSGCTFSLTPSSQPMVVGGGASNVMVNASGGCSWTALSNVPWITITAGASGTDGGTVQFTVDVNATGASRDGTMTIAGQTFTVSQAGS